jgi:hypothetical protein
MRHRDSSVRVSSARQRRMPHARDRRVPCRAARRHWRPELHLTCILPYFVAATRSEWCLPPRCRHASSSFARRGCGCGLPRRHSTSEERDKAIGDDAPAPIISLAAKAFIQATSLASGRARLSMALVASCGKGAATIMDRLQIFLARMRTLPGALKRRRCGFFCACRPCAARLPQLGAGRVRLASAPFFAP